ncbi:MAG: hypothetical protein ACRENP_19385 [Longimicrobiales bacterium]
MRFLSLLLSLPWLATTHAVAQNSPRGTPVEIVRTPRLSLGVDAGDPNLEFDQVVTPFLLRDGRVVVPTRGSNSIRVFRASGQLLSSHGRGGAGPGEFRSIIAAWARSDTIEVFDNRLSRITRFLPNGTVEVVTLTTKQRDLSLGAGPLPDGWIVGGVESATYPGRDQIVLRRFSRSGADLGEVARVQGFARYHSPVITGPEPLSPTPVMDVQNGRGYVADNLTPRIQIINARGQPEREVRWTPERVHPVRATLRMVIDSAVARAKPVQAVRTRQRWEDARVPEQVPVFASFIVDDQGFIWVRPFEPLVHAMALGGLNRTGPGGVWTILSPDGVKVGSVKVPDDIEPMQITTNALVGIVKDDLGVESVRVHELKRK